MDEAVRRILRVKIALGLFEHPYADETRASQAPGAASRRRRACDGGPTADDGGAVMGSWTGDGRAEEAVTVLAGLRAALPDAKVTFAKGCTIMCDSDAGFAEAVAAAKGADAVVFALGEAGDMTGEASSRAFLDLPGRQQELAEAVLAAGKPTAVVLLNGRPLTLSALAERAPAILEAWQPGTEAGDAIADVLFGDAGPGGKLPMTFPRAVGQIPLYYNHKNTGRPPVEGDRVNTGHPLEDSNHYTSKYLDLPVTPLFPFGWGLGYSSTRLSGLAVAPAKISPEQRASVRVFVENTGERAGDEVVELYIRRRAASVTRPVAELKGFQRVTLQPGEKRRVDFNLGPKKLGFYGLDMKFGVEPGDYEIFAGTSSVGGLTARDFPSRK